jgi:predicted amidohydrolase YtcJ
MPQRTVVINADLGPLRPGISAFSIEDGVFTAVVDQSDAADLTNAGAAIIDAERRAVLPGIDDSHLHGYEYGRSLTACDLRGVRTPHELNARLRTAGPEANGWVRGIGWDDTTLKGTGPNGYPCAADLDAAFTDIPVIIGDATGHQALCNSAALRAAGVTASTADPSGGVFVRHTDGSPTGLLYEAAVGVINDAIPPLSITEQKQAILTAQQEMLRQGVTAFTDPGLGPGARTLMDGTGDLGAVEAYRELDAAGELIVRANLMLLYGGLGGTTAAAVADGLDAWGAPMRGAAFSHLDIAQVKVFADGIPRSRTAWVTEPYDDGCCGHLQVAGNTDEERVAELMAIVDAAVSRGWQVGAHSIGDRTITSFLDAIEESGTYGTLRHYVIHGDLISHPDLVRMASMQMALNTNPSIRWMVGRSVSPILGDARNLSKQPLRTAIDTGVRLCTSSDAPVAPPDWRTIIAAAITRSLKAEPDYTDAQRITPLEAIRSMTSNAAWQSHADTWRGSIGAGMAADFIVLDTAVDWNDPWSLTNSEVASTYVDGNCVYGPSR